MKPLHPGNFQAFLDAYREALQDSYKANPESYTWRPDQFDTVFGRMSEAIESGSFNKDSPAFKKACRVLGINHTYKAITEFISL